MKYQPNGWNGFFTASVYDLEQTNVTSTELIDGVNYSVQSGRVEVQGVELSGLASLTGGLDLILNYTYTDAEITASGNRPANVPEHAGKAWLDYTSQSGTFEGLGFGGGIRYVGSRYDLNTNANELDGNTLLDAAAHYRLGHHRASLNVSNLTDEKYVATCGNFGCFYGDVVAMQAESSFWDALPSVQAGRVRTLEPVNPFGALPAACHFARLLTDALTAGVDLG